MSTDIGARLKAIRLDRGLSRDELYAATKVSTTSIIRIEQNRQQPTAGVLVALAQALDCTSDEILGLVPFEPRDRPKKEIERIIERDRTRYSKISSPSKRRRGSKPAYMVQASLRDPLTTPFGAPLMYPNIHENAVLPGQTHLAPGRFFTIWAASATRALTCAIAGSPAEISTPASPPLRAA